MKTSQAEARHPFKRRGPRFWLGCLVLLVGLPILFYYGYCWGLWGQHSLLLQYFFQCSCPAASEEARYPDEVDVIVSACQHVTISRLSPSGHFLYVYAENFGLVSAYLLNLQTMERMTEVPDQSFSSFLTDDLWFVERGLDDYIMDRATGAQFPIRRFVYSHPSGQINGETNLALLAQSLREAEHIFLIGASTDKVVALASDPYIYPERNFIAEKYDVPGFNMERFLRENNVTYQTILPDFPHEVVSPNGKFVARDDGIYLADTNQLIVRTPPALVRGWTNEGKAAIYSSNGRCLLRRGLPFSDDIGCAIKVPQPVLKLWVPEEYLFPAESP